MSSRPVVKSSTMEAEMTEYAIQCSIEAIRNGTSESDIATEIKQTFEDRFKAKFFFSFSFFHIERV